MEFFFIGHGFCFKKKTTMADFDFLRTSFFLTHPVYLVGLIGLIISNNYS